MLLGVRGFVLIKGSIENQRKGLYFKPYSLVSNKFNQWQLLNPQYDDN